MKQVSKLVTSNMLPVKLLGFSDCGRIILLLWQFLKKKKLLHCANAHAKTHHKLGNPMNPMIFISKYWLSFYEKSKRLWKPTFSQTSWLSRNSAT